MTKEMGQPWLQHWQRYTINVGKPILEGLFCHFQNGMTDSCGMCVSKATNYHYQMRQQNGLAKATGKQSIWSLHMKTKVVQYVPRTNINLPYVCMTA